MVTAVAACDDAGMEHYWHVAFVGLCIYVVLATLILAHGVQRAHDRLDGKR